MTYIVFARKYRPKTFNEIIGQSHVTTTLENAISQDRVAHAYLFAGPRGIGKTTTARILAKALNCEKGPRPEPCNSCASCNEITKGMSLDVLEIDGASNRGIDEIRNLRENVKFAPSKGRFKVYIIDEVHMLTPEAFNALLKTLEEPPPHAKFIFATTQAHKVPPTILSRCQRFDFRKISAKDILDNLKHIAEKEGLNVNDEALSLIARYADGSMRDGQVILDQITSSAQGAMDVKELSTLLGVLDEEVLFGFSKFIKEKDTASALKTIDRLVEEGKEMAQVVSNLIEHFRNLSVIKISKDLNSFIDIGPDKVKRYLDESERFTIEEIMYIIYTLSNTIDLIRRSNLARIPFEVAMVKLTRMGSITSLAEIMERLKVLEERLHEAKIDNEMVPGQNVPGRAKSENPKDKDTEEKASSKSTEEAKDPARTSDLDEVSSSWTGVLNYVKTKKMSIGSYLQEGYPEALDSNTLTIGFPKELQFHKEMFDSLENRCLVEEAIKSVLKADLKINFILVEPVKLKGRIPKEDLEEISADDFALKEEKAKDMEPIVKTALEVFDGQVANEIREKEKKR